MSYSNMAGIQLAGGEIMATQKNRGGKNCPAAFYTIWEACDMLGIPKSTVNHYAEKGDFSELLPDIFPKIIRVRDSYLMPKGVFDKYLKNGMYWVNTNKNGKVGRPAKWVEGKYINFRTKIPNDLNERINYAVNIANSMSAGAHMSKNDTILLAIEEFLQRRPQFDLKNK